MHLNEYQREARLFAVNDDLMHFAFGLVEEAGEAAGVLKRLFRGDPGYGNDLSYRDYGLSDGATEKLVYELGDILWHVAVLADNLGYTLADVANANIAKLEDRQQRNMIKGSGDDR